VDDRVEQDLGVAALVSDRGSRHERNEDAGEVAVHATGIAAVVCDGVSTTANPDQASAAAAGAAIEILRRWLDDPGGDGADAVRQAVAAGRRAIEDVPATEPGGYPAAPSTTMVLAVTTPGSVLLAGIGDSRVYWVGADGNNVRLTVDDSWAEAAIAAGVPEDDAYLSPQAHVITRWLGGDAPDDDPAVSSVIVEVEGLLVVCSDGLWNYLPDPDAIGAAVQAAVDPSGVAAPITVARHLVQVALDAGGADNVTVAVLQAGPGSGAADTTQVMAVESAPGDNTDPFQKPL
jgi:serine/threonine protein phosphatase PrpC